MASLTPREPASLQERLSALDKLADGVNKKAGKPIMGRIGQNPEIMEKLKIKFIPTPGDQINEAMGGGWPRGRMSLVAGNPDSGKTSLLLETIAYNMKNPNFVAGWLESENSLKKEYICDMFGIDPNRFFFIEADRDGAAEEALDRIQAAIATNAFDIVVINSLKALVPSEEHRKSFNENSIGIQSRLNAKMTRKFTSIVSESGAAFVVITHLSTEIGSMSRDPLIISGGKAIAYASVLTIDLRKRSVLDTDPITREEGIKIGLTVKKNHCVPDRNPYLKTDYYAIFGEGIEQILTTLELAVDEGILRKAGAWIKEEDEKGNVVSWNGHEINFQGKEKFRIFAKEHPEYLEYLKSKINGTVVEQQTEEEIALAKEEEKAMEEKKLKKKSKKKGA